MHTPAGVKKTKKLRRAALETQRRGLGFSLVEVVTMCPTGWFTTPGDGPKFQQDNLLPVFPVGELKRPRDLTVQVRAPARIPCATERSVGSRPCIGDMTSTSTIAVAILPG